MDEPSKAIIPTQPLSFHLMIKKSLNHSEATREIFKADGEQSSHRWNVAVWSDATIQTKDSSRTTYPMIGNLSKHMRRKSSLLYFTSSCILCFKYMFALFI